DPRGLLAFVGGRHERNTGAVHAAHSRLHGRQGASCALATTAKKLDRLITGVSTARLRKRPVPEKWSVSEIVAHLGDAEIVGGFRMRLILGSPGAPIVAYDQNKWVTSGHYDKRDPRKSVEQFRVLREGNLALLKSLE